ncbi:MAG: hypothetical protein PHY02_02915 [Phycisphaerae bacterium]|nr:hypothetical protein [Phycisphaerae bacterium]
MKTLIISMLVLLTVFFISVPVFGQAPGDTPLQPTEQKQESAKGPMLEEDTADVNEVADANTVADTNVPADANATAYANAVKAKIGGFEGLSEALSGINTAGGDEIREWTRGRLDNRYDLIVAAQKQTDAELNFLRELAVKEGALKTTAAIDGILLDRQERFKAVIAELEKKSERLHRRNEMMERRKEREERNKERKKDIQQ